MFVVDLPKQFNQNRDSHAVVFCEGGVHVLFTSEKQKKLRIELHGWIVSELLKERKTWLSCLTGNASLIRYLWFVKLKMVHSRTIQRYVL